MDEIRFYHLYDRAFTKKKLQKKIEEFVNL